MTSGASNCGAGHHHGAGGTSSFALLWAVGEVELYNAACKERQGTADFVGLDALLDKRLGEKHERLGATGLNVSSSLCVSGPSNEDPPAVDPSSPESVDASSPDSFFPRFTANDAMSMP